jgi:DnaJ-class molecular chaperone
VCLGEGSFSFVPPRDPDTGTCPRCYGLGTVLTGSRVPAHMVRDCPDCHGRGYVDLRALHEDLQLRIGAGQGPDTPLEESLPEEPREP